MKQENLVRVPSRGHIAFEQGTKHEWFCHCERTQVHQAIFPGYGKVIRINSSYMDAIEFMYLGGAGHPVS